MSCYAVEMETSSTVANPMNGEYEVVLFFLCPGAFIP